MYIACILYNLMYMIWPWLKVIKIRAYRVLPVHSGVHRILEWGFQERAKFTIQKGVLIMFSSTFLINYTLIYAAL